MTMDQLVDVVFSIPTERDSATVNLVGVPGIISAKENKMVADTYAASTMAIIDGMPIVKIARKQGIICDRCAAPDIMPNIFENSVRQGKTHYFYGGKDKDVLRKLRENLEKDYPGIQIVGMFSPPFRPLTDEEDKQVCDEINSVHPDFLWVGIGAPKQELWMRDHQEKIKGTVMVGVGAGFNFLAGTLNRAPEWMKEAGLEWLFRLTKEPKRLWKRYVIGGFKWIYYYYIKP
jgi:N-acetylglucosaminyldiphosphoundecaprenol N-acetyl-beta-D-mannosaminyltransferase